MFEILGVLTVIWFGYIIVKAIYNVNERTRSQEIGKEARRIAINDFRIPERYYNYTILNHMSEVKQDALALKENNDSLNFRGIPWARFLAYVIYCGFRDDCEQSFYGHPRAQDLLDELDIPQKTISEELERNSISILKRQTSKELRGQYAEFLPDDGDGDGDGDKVKKEVVSSPDIIEQLDNAYDKHEQKCRW